jgi:CBS domain containing-hemolysin-like protein
MPTDLLLLLIFFFLLLLSAFFSGTETAYTAVNETTLLTEERRADPRSAIAQKLIHNRSNIIGAVLIGNNVVNTILPVLATVLFESLLNRTPTLPLWLAPILAGAISIVFLLLCGEVVPKSIAVANSTEWALIAAQPTRILVTLLAPLIFLLNIISKLINKFIQPTEKRRGELMIQELISMSRLTRQAGAIDHLEAKLLNRAAILNDHSAGDILVPRQEVCFLSAKASFEEVRETFIREQYSRIPVYQETPDNIIGLLHFKEVVPLPENQTAPPKLSTFIHPPLFVPESKSIGSLMEEMRSGGNHLAIVIDEFSAPVGIVTLEDILEFLVGAIRDEFDPNPTAEEPLPRNPGQEEVPAHPAREIPGRLLIIHFERQFKIHIPSEFKKEASTMAGLVLHVCGALPEAGYQASLPGVRLTVKKVGRQRIERLLVEFPGKAPVICF